MQVRTATGNRPSDMAAIDGTERMSEQTVEYLLKNTQTCDKLDTDIDVMRGRLRHIKIQLLSLLVELDRALGDEPSVMTRAERRRR